MRQVIYYCLSTLLLCFSTLAYSADEYLLGPGDMLKISVYGNPDMNTEARVSGSGTITFPLLGEVRVAGFGKQGVEERISQLLQRGGYLKNPQVNVLITDFISQQVSILGYVARPGKYATAHARTLAEILAMAGGVNAEGGDSVSIIRQNGSESFKTEVSLRSIFQPESKFSDVKVSGGDIVYVPRASIFYIYGEVQRPGMYRLSPEMTVMQALAVGGGLTLRGTERGIKITRRGTDGKVHMLGANLTQTLQQNDVVYVKESLF